MYTALKRRGVETVMVRYPREDTVCASRSIASMRWSERSIGLIGI